MHKLYRIPKERLARPLWGKNNISKIRKRSPSIKKRLSSLWRLFDEGLRYSRIKGIYYLPHRACITSAPMVSSSIFVGFCASLLDNNATPDALYTVVSSSVHVFSLRSMRTV